jgi:predicted nucleic acid-binding protein
MKTALDSSVILDVVTNDPQWADASERAIKEAYSLGQLVVCECVIAEIAPAFALGDLETFLLDWKIRHIPSTFESAAAAGEMYRSYLLRGGAAKRVIPDFLIGSHAMHHADRLLARDRGYYRDYFTNLKVIEPA